MIFSVMGRGWVLFIFLKFYCVLFTNWTGRFTNWTGFFTNWTGRFTNWTVLFTNWTGRFTNWTILFTNWTGLFMNWTGLFTNWTSLLQTGPIFFELEKKKRRTFCVQFVKRHCIQLLSFRPKAFCLCLSVYLFLVFEQLVSCHQYQYCN